MEPQPSPTGLQADPHAVLQADVTRHEDTLSSADEDMSQHVEYLEMDTFDDD